MHQPLADGREGAAQLPAGRLALHQVFLEGGGELLVLGPVEARARDGVARPLPAHLPGVSQKRLDARKHLPRLAGSQTAIPFIAFIAYIASVNEKASADEIAELDAAAPRLYLSSYGLKISAGTSFNALSYVENAEDDVDSKDRLYTDISVDGLSEMKTSEPGTYELVFYCYDSSGNRSNRAKMTVIVE